MSADFFRNKKRLHTNMPKSYRNKGAKSYYWVGTWNHKDERESLLPGNAELLQNHGWFKKIYASEERGNCGTLHIQFYVECVTRKTRTDMEEEFPEVLWYRRVTSNKMSRDYCTGLDFEGKPKYGWIRSLIKKSGKREKKTPISSLEPQPDSPLKPLKLKRDEGTNWSWRVQEKIDEEDLKEEEEIVRQTKKRKLDIELNL